MPLGELVSSIMMLCRQPCSQLSPERGTSKCSARGRSSIPKGADHLYGLPG
jgi:hypothetical protein